MIKNIGLFWLKEDFRLKKNLALAEATLNHDQVVAFYLYKSSKFENQEAQKWWIANSIIEFQKSLSKYNINLEIHTKTFSKNFLKKKIFQSIGTKLTSLII